MMQSNRKTAEKENLNCFQSIRGHLSVKRSTVWSVKRRGSPLEKRLNLKWQYMDSKRFPYTLSRHRLGGFLWLASTP